MAGHDVVVIGGSAGALEALRALISQLPGDLPASVFVVIHSRPDGTGMLAHILARSGRLPAVYARDKDILQTGRIYVAPSDRHLLLNDGCMRVVYGPRHNRHRPAIDPLFETASRAHGTRVVGVMLSGTQDDGALGLRTIHRRGGLAIVQDPQTAVFPGMPREALALVPEAEVVPLERLGITVARMVERPAVARVAPPDAGLERRFQQYMDRRVDMEAVGTPSVFACPDCNGVLWEVEEGDVLRFRCRIGHSYSPRGLLEGHEGAVEQALATALRALEESASLQKRVALRMSTVEGAQPLRNKVEELEASADVIRQILAKNNVTGGQESEEG